MTYKTNRSPPPDCIILEDRCTFEGVVMPQKHTQCNPLAHSQSLISEGFIFILLYDGLAQFQKTSKL